MSIYLTTWRQWVQELVCRQKWSRTSCDTFCDNHPLELCFPFEAVIILKPLNFLLQRCDWLTVWTASPQIPETCDPNAGLWWWSCWELQEKKQGKKNTPRRSSTSDRVVFGSLCWIWLTKGMMRVFYDQALSKVKQNYCDQQNSLSSNGKRTLSAWMRLKHNQISVKFTKFIFYFIFLVLFCFVFSYIHYKLGLSTISAPQVSATANRLHKSGGPLVNKNWGWHKVYKFITYSLIRRYGRSSLGARCERWLKWFNWKGCFTLSEKVENIYAI